jgi:hypothetical protein
VIFSPPNLLVAKIDSPGVLKKSSLEKTKELGPHPQWRSEDDPFVK